MKYKSLEDMGFWEKTWEFLKDCTRGIGWAEGILLAVWFGLSWWNGGVVFAITLTIGMWMFGAGQFSKGRVDGIDFMDELWAPMHIRWSEISQEYYQLLRRDYL